MKKFLAILLAIVMVLSLAACGGGEETKDEEKETEKATDPKVTVEGAELKTPLWTLIYDEAVWSYEEDELYDDEDWSKVCMYIYDEDNEDEYVVCAEVWASVEDHGDFRDMLTQYGFDAQEYADGDCDTEKLGGLDCLSAEGESWGESYRCWFAREEGAGTTVFVEVRGDLENENIDALLAGLTFTLEDSGNEDAPWPWEGEAFQAEDASATVGGFTVESTWIPFAEPMITTDTFDHFIGVTGQTAYISSSGAVSMYDLSDELELNKTMKLDGEYEYIYADEIGMVWMSAFMEDFIGVVDGSEVANYGELDYVAVSPDGTWGVSWFSGPECKLVEIGYDEISTSDVTFGEVELISHLNVDNDYIYVCGSGEDDAHKVYVYNKSGSLQMTLCDENGEGLGSVTFMAQFDGGFLGFDGNMRELVLWDEQGQWLGSIEDGDLFGTYYPWFCGGALLEDGSVMIIMTEEREDESAMELVAFKLNVQ